jgi:cytochrome c biogenesis protein CcdA
MYLLAANLIAIVHGLTVLCVVIGAVMALTGVLRRHRRWEAAYYLLLFLVILSDVWMGECVLTEWEQRLRDLHQPGSAYRGSFIGHYFGFLPRPLHTHIGPALIAGALLAFPLWRLADRIRKRRQGSRKRLSE